MVKILTIKRIERNWIKQMHTIDSLVIKNVVVAGEIDRLMFILDYLINVKASYFRGK